MKSVFNDDLKFYTKEEGKPKINTAKLNKFLEANGFYKLKKSNQSYLLVHIENNVVEEINPFVIKDFLKSFLSNSGEEEILEVLMKGTGLLTNSSLEFLPSTEFKFKRGTATSGFFYFENVFVEVTADAITQYDYKDLEMPIWKSKVVKRKLDLIDTGVSEFSLFVRHLANEDEERIASMCSIIGYLLHDYKDHTRSKAIILIDQNISDDGRANGGTGKSLVMKGVKQMASTVTKDGKNLKQKSNFQFQQVSQETEVLYFDDVRNDFDFESLYSTITDGIPVERKYQQEIHIPYEESPKIVISSNFIVKGAGGYTDDRRRIDFEVSGFYGPHRSPATEFGKQFFTDWSESEWNHFYLFMIGCVQFYLQNGFILPKPINIAENTLISRTCREFPAFAKEELSNDGDYIKEDVLSKFKSQNRGHETLLSNTFSKWIAAWEEYQYKSLKIIQKQSNGKNMIVVRKREE